MSDLKGLKVVTVEQAVAIPLCSRHLADLGADVLKIENPAGGDFARDYDDYVHGWSSAFVWLNRGKRSVALDLKSAEGLDAFRDLLSQADVLLCNLAPGALERIVPDESLSELNPRLIRCYVSGYGSSGPRAGQKAYDLIIQAETGAIAVTGTEQSPAKIGVSVADLAGGTYALSSVLAALHQRDRTGLGKRVDIALFDALLEWMSPFLMAHRYTGDAPTRAGLHHSSIVPYGPFTTADGDDLYLAVQNEPQWQRLCTTVMEDPGLAAADGYHPAVERVRNRASVQQRVQSTFSDLTTEHALQLLKLADVPFGRMQDLAEVLTDPQTQTRLASGILPTGESFDYILSPFEQQPKPAPVTVPCLGGQTADVLVALDRATLEMKRNQSAPAASAQRDLAGASPDLDDLAAQLHSAELTNCTIQPLSEQVPGLTVADSYRIQQLNVSRRLRDGGVIVGQKVGLTSVAMQEQLGVDEPDYGVLFDGMLVDDGQPIPVSGLIQPRVEAEVAFVMERELRGPGVTEADALEAIAGALPVIEVIDSRISAWKIGLTDTIADNASCARVVRGEAVTPIADIDLRTMGMILTINGEVVSTAAGAAVLGNPIRGLVWLANRLAEFGVSLRPGDLVLAGALHASIPVAEGMSVHAEFAGIGGITAEFTS
ncbi:hypothetical protein ASG90_01025 [Nocardioides sp. Soil797]|nr:hypothetical protein ASG90_01025 [Nocardioides sp. Soil797]